MCSETSSLRLSFSFDLCDSDVSPLKQDDEYSKEDMLRVDQSTSDFEFSICNSLEYQSSSADELFSNGVILPFQMNKNKNFSHKDTFNGENPSLSSSHTPQPYPPSVDKAKKENYSKEILDVNPLQNQKSQSKSFWGFNRSKSLNFDTKRRLLRSFPLLSRSNSTGSAANPKKDAQKHNQNKQPLMAKKSSFSTASSPSSPSALSFYSMQHKHPLSKRYGGSYINGIRVSPVLNVPPPSISKSTANLFGLGSMLRCGKDKTSKR